MAKDLWLPKGFELSDGSKIRSLLYSGDEWQIFDTNGSNNILLTRPELARKWDEFGFLDESLFGDVAFAATRLGEWLRSGVALVAHWLDVLVTYVLGPTAGSTAAALVSWLPAAFMAGCTARRAASIQCQ